MDESLSVIFFISAILIFGGILFAVISLTKGSPRQLDRVKYQSRWLSIETKLLKDDTNTHSLSVLEADKLLDKAMRERGAPGATMGERMKHYKGKWTNENGIWNAHKLRNQIAHEDDVTVTYDRACQALAAFKQGLKDLGAL